MFVGCCFLKAPRIAMARMIDRIVASTGKPGMPPPPPEGWACNVMLIAVALPATALPVPAEDVKPVLDACNV